MISHPLARYSSQDPSHKPWAYAFTALSGYLAFFYQAGRKILSNPKEWNYFQGYFKDLIALAPRYEQVARNYFSNFRSFTLRDDQVSLLMQLARSREYALAVVEDQGQRYHINEILKLLRTVANDATKITSQKDNRVNNLRFLIKNFAEGSDESGLRGWGKLKTELHHYVNIIDAHTRSLTHYADLMWNQKDRYGSMLKYSWSRNVPELIGYLMKEEELIHDKLGGLEHFTATPEESEVFLEIGKNLRWEIIYDNHCPFEQEAMGHCATARAGCYLLSLREKTRYWDRWDSKTQKFITKDLKEEIWLPRVTATVCPTYDGQSGEYVVLDILGPKNMRVEKKWYDAIKVLFNDPRIVEEERQQSDRNFTTKDLTDEDQEALYQKKPSIAPASWKILKATKTGFKKIYLDAIKSYAKTGKAEFLITEFKALKDGYYQIFEADHFDEMLVKLEKISSNRSKISQEIEELQKRLEDYYDYDVSMGRREMADNFNDFYQALTDEQKLKLDKVVGVNLWELEDDDERWRAVEDHDVANAFYDAYRTGWEVGTQDSMYHAYQNAFDGLQFYSEQNQPSITLTKDKKKWRAIISKKELAAILVDQEEFDLSPDLMFAYDSEFSINSSRYPFYGDVEYEYDYDSSAAYERFKEEIEGYLDNE